jgi:tripartite-type tricarboxylate transporter receptor subunit TctC
MKKLAAFVAGFLFASIAVAQDYPNRPVKLIQGFPPGGNADVVARILGQEMSKGLGQPIVVEARPGAAGNIAAEAVARAAPDGYTLLLVTGGHAVAGASYKSLPYHSVNGFAMISTATFFPFVIATRADGKHQSLPALPQAAKAAPESVTLGAAGPGVTQHLTGELLASMAGVKFLYVPYKGDAGAVTALLGSQTSFIITPATAVLPHVKAGTFKVLAATGPVRWSGLPDVPTVDESGVRGFDVRSWIGLATTAGTPRPIVERLNQEMQRTLQAPDVRERLEQIGGEVRGSTPEEMRDRVATEVERWSQVIRAAKIEQQ